jgi:glutathione synthase
MKLLFIADPLDGFKIHKDSTFAMMREAQSQGHDIWCCEPSQLQWQQGARVSAMCQHIQLTGETETWFKVLGQQQMALSEVSAVLMRKDPPFDIEYLYTTHLLSQAEREGARVFNRAEAIRQHPEKLSILEFPDLIAPTMVSSDMAALKQFHQAHGDVIFKPLDGMGGSGIFRIQPDGMNLGSVLEVLTNQGRTAIMAQKYLSAITAGDKRVLLIDGEPVPFALARIPQGQEVRGNLAAGGKGVAQALTDSDKRIAHTLGPVLAARGLFLVGLDIIGEHLTEINVTSPTCFQEITQQTGHDVAAQFMRALAHRLAQPA